MNHLSKIPVIVILSICPGLFLISCKKKPTLPVVTTNSVTAITTTTATAGGNVTGDGGAEVVFRGVCWNTSENPVVTNSKTSDGAGTGSFTSSLTQLTPGTTYYVRAYATNSEGTSYGSQVSFLTNQVVVPTLTTTAISSITSTAAVSGGVISSDGGSNITSKGICWGTAPNPTTANSKTSDGTGTGVFTSNMTNLLPGTTYYVKAYAINSIGTGYGNELSFATTCTAPAATTDAATGVSESSATLNGTVDANGSSTVVTFEYGTSTSYGSTIAAVPSPVTGSNNTSVSAGVTGLSQNTTYHYRVKAVSCGGTIYGADRTFTTVCTPPSAVTSTATGIGTSAATLNGSVNAHGSSTTVTFEYGTTSGYGSQITAVPSPVTGSNNTSVSAGLTGLLPNTTYHFRVKAVSCGGTIYGTDQSFTTGCTAPSAVTNAATSVGPTTATLNGSVNAHGSSTVVTFEYGLTTSYGNTRTATQSPVTGSSNTPVSAGITGLSPNTTYHYRVKAVSCGGTIYGTDQQLTTAAVKSSVHHVGINNTNINLTTLRTVGQISINPVVSGKVIVTFDGLCVSSPGDRIILAASNTTNWGINDGHVEAEAYDNDINGNSFSHTRVYDVTPGSRTFYALAQNYLETDGTGLASIYGSLTVKFIPASGSIVAFAGINRTGVNLTNVTSVGTVTINPSVSGKAIVRFDGFCVSTPGDRIVLAASNTTNWGINDGNVNIEAINSDLNTKTFSHTRVYDVSPGSRTFYAVAQNYAETDGTGIASVYGSLTVQFVPNTDASVAFQGINRSSLNLSSSTTLNQITINPAVSGRVLVWFDGLCVSSPGDNIILAASNSTSWGVNDGNVSVESINSDLDRNSFSHTRVYTITPGSRTFYAVGHNYVETAGTGIASVYGSITVQFFPD